MEPQLCCANKRGWLGADDQTSKPQASSTARLGQMSSCLACTVASTSEPCFWSLQRPRSAVIMGRQGLGHVPGSPSLDQIAPFPLRIYRRRFLSAFIPNLSSPSGLLSSPPMLLKHLSDFLLASPTTGKAGRKWTIGSPPLSSLRRTPGSAPQSHERMETLLLLPAAGPLILKVGVRSLHVSQI